MFLKLIAEGIQIQKQQTWTFYFTKEKSKTYNQEPP